MSYGLWTNGKVLGGLNCPSLLFTDIEPYCDQNGEKFYTPGNYIPGNEIFVVGNTGRVFGGSSGYPSFGGLSGWSTSGNTVKLSFNVKNQKAFFTNFSCYQIQRPQSVTDSYGIMIQDSVNWMSINSDSRLGFVTWQGTVDITGSWVLPQVINDASKTVFCNFNDPNLCLFHNRDANRLEVWRDSSGESVNQGTLRVNIVIISSGFYPATPNGYGMVIKNASGNNTYTSDTTPMIWDGRYWQVPWVAGEWRDTGISRPMMPLPIIGYHGGDQIFNGGRRNYYTNGFRMSGSSISYWRNGGGWTPQTLNFSQQFYSSQISMPILNADNYF